MTPDFATRFLAPAVFVFLWSSGFVVARGVRHFADPDLFLVARFTSTALLFVCIAVAGRRRWPPLRHWPMHMIVGGVQFGGYLGAVYWAVGHGLAAGVAALIAALQPPITAIVAARMLRERVPLAVVAGLALGFAGVALVVAPHLGGAGGFPPLAVAVAFAGTLAVTGGMILQKTHLAAADLVVTNVLQNGGGVAFALVAAWLLGEHRWVAVAPLYGWLAYSVVGLSGIAGPLFIWLMRRGEAARTTSLLFLVPALSALQAWLLFGETLGPVQILGFAVALAGVTLARKRETS
ncbi:MAG: DMT family transporter [Rhodospirillales bacterium]|nr:DMT family transporter [Rhodospirillales bacterium]